MIFTGYIKHLQKLDEMETEIYSIGPNPYITFTDDQRKRIDAIKETQRYIVEQMARALGIIKTDGGIDYGS